MAERRLGPVFNFIVDTYDNIRFVRGPAERLVAIAKIKPGQRVLDIACGTGWATMAAVKAAGDRGKATGIDIAEKMLDVARRKAEAAGLSNIEYRTGDAESLEFNEGSYDTVICASSIFLLSDIPKALKEWRRVLKRGGRVAFSSFGVNFMRPAYTLFLERLTKYDGMAPPAEQFGIRTSTTERCRQLLENAGFKKIEITSEQFGGYLHDTQDYWQEISSTVMRPRLLLLGPERLGKFRAEHLAEIEVLRTDKGIWMDVPVHFSLAVK